MITATFFIGLTITGVFWFWYEDKLKACGDRDIICWILIGGEYLVYLAAISQSYLIFSLTNFWIRNSFLWVWYWTCALICASFTIAGFSNEGILNFLIAVAVNAFLIGYTLYRYFTLPEQEVSKECEAAIKMEEANKK